MNLDKLSRYINSTLSQGFSEEEIKEALLSENWPEYIVDKEISRIKNTLNNQNAVSLKQKPALSFNPLFKLREMFQQSKESNIITNKIKGGSKMSKKITAEQARVFLRQIDSEKSFWVNSGSVLRNLEEFSNELKSIEPEHFSHHVNKEKNDFATWVSDVIGDQMLAKNLSRAKTPKTLSKTVDKRLDYLKKMLD